MFLLIQLQRFLAVGCFDELVAFGLKKIYDELAHELLVVGNQYFFHYALPLFIRIP